VAKKMTSNRQIAIISFLWSVVNEVRVKCDFTGLFEMPTSDNGYYVLLASFDENVDSVAAARASVYAIPHGQPKHTSPPGRNGWLWDDL
jgi:hypothetical protein